MHPDLGGDGRSQGANDQHGRFGARREIGSARHTVGLERLQSEGVRTVVVGDLGCPDPARAAQGLERGQGSIQAIGIRTARPEKVQLIAPFG